jgi:glycine cleavage system regulatory protein
MALRSPFRRAGSLTFAKQVAKLSRGIVSMPFGARPHLMVTATGRHRPGTTSDLTEVVFEHGLSIAGTKKVMLEERFTIMLALWVPPGGASPAQVCRTLESDEVAERLGFDLKLDFLDLDAPRPTDAPDAPDATEAVKRRFKLQCPQKPGIVLAVTELLRGHGCVLSEISADTAARDSEIWFTIECIVEVPAGVRVEAVEEGLHLLASHKDERATLVFDGKLGSAQRNWTPLSHA